MKGVISSDHAEEIADNIMRSWTGVTALMGQVCIPETKKVPFCVIQRRQLPVLKTLVKKRTSLRLLYCMMLRRYWRGLQRPMSDKMFICYITRVNNSM